MTPTNFPDYPLLDLALAEFLAGVGVCQNPYKVQQNMEATPAVFLNWMPDSPPLAMMLAVSADNRMVDDVNPRVTVNIAVRGGVEDALRPRNVHARIFELLHNSGRLRLTADQEILDCRRTAKGVQVLDSNRRWVRVDSYTIMPLNNVPKG